MPARGIHLDAAATAPALQPNAEMRLAGKTE
ncbi:hypothetical protein XBLMG947_1123 [Xanthomonas bromi]|uniref:Uncharacterized protein n=1 Tax=Xanthomonas bromi TaxID=56449 RepID=A0A1C3NIW9_9XANT|nr:hypothetical protein XBLMG947_1123 [Xanthomonas bromi]